VGHGGGGRRSGRRRLVAPEGETKMFVRSPAKPGSGSGSGGGNTGTAGSAGTAGKGGTGTAGTGGSTGTGYQSCRRLVPHRTARVRKGPEGGLAWPLGDQRRNRLRRAVAPANAAARPFMIGAAGPPGSAKCGSSPLRRGCGWAQSGPLRLPLRAPRRNISTRCLPSP
jgi:hypothetical protein